MQDITNSQQHCHNDSEFLLDPDNISCCREEDKWNENLENDTENSWLYEDYNEEVWFDVNIS